MDVRAAARKCVQTKQQSIAAPLIRPADLMARLISFVISPAVHVRFTPLA